MNKQIITASHILGEKVVNPRGEKLGTIKDLVIDMSSGRVSYAVLSFGGFLGMIEKLFAIPVENFRKRRGETCFVLNITEDKLEAAQEFDKDNWPRTPQAEFINSGARISGYYANNDTRKAICAESRNRHRSSRLNI